MERGVDTELFHGAKRDREADGKAVFGYVGRLSTEKNLRVLKRLEQALMAAGLSDYRIDIVGHGAESAWLAADLRKARQRGVLLGEPLARAYADMDVFLFPSRTDTYGNVVWEAAASGVPAVVMDAGGPQYIVRDGRTKRSWPTPFACSAIASLGGGWARRRAWPPWRGPGTACSTVSTTRPTRPPLLERAVADRDAPNRDQEAAAP